MIDNSTNIEAGSDGISPITGTEVSSSAQKHRFGFSIMRRPTLPAAGRHELHTPIPYGRPTLELLSRCIRENVFQLIATRKIHTRIGGTKRLQAIVDELKPKMALAKAERAASLMSLEISPDFSWKNQWKSAFPLVLELLANDVSPVIERSVLDDASHFANEKNATFIEGNKYGYFNPDRFFKDVGVRIPWTEGKLPQARPPLTPKERDLVMLSVGKEPVMLLALEFLAISQKIGVQLSTADALRLAAVKIAGNEFGHGVDYALASRGIHTYQRATALFKSGVLTNSDIDLPRVGVDIHRELFARGIDDIVIERYLQRKGFTAEQISQFFLEERMVGRSAVKETRRLLSENFTKEHSLILANTQHAIGMTLQEIDPDNAKDMTPHFEHALQYREVPYSREIITQIAKTS